jgi:hypothetical protein
VTIEKLECVYPDGEKKEFKIMYSPTVIRKINKWADQNRAEIMWLSSWDERANTYFAPAVGANKFEVAREEGGFKLDAITKQNPDRIVIWVDDTLTTFLSENQFDEKYAKGVFKRPNTVLIAPKNGLTREHLDLISSVLKNPNIARGKTINKFDEGAHRDGGACVIN